MNKIKSLWTSLPDSVRRVIHAFWQSFISVFVLGILSVVSGLMSTHDVSVATAALVALVVAAVTSGLSAVKGLAVAAHK